VTKAKTKPKAKAKGGRPSKYKPEFVQRAAELCAFGATDRDLAKVFKVTESTVSKWKIDYPEFSEALKNAKAIVDAKVERSLFERAMGYSHPETKVFCNADGHVTTVDLVKVYPPDPTSMIFWLKNRRPELWRDKQEHDHNVHGNLTVENTSVTDDDKAMIRELRKRREDARVTH
jgi:hypothetical protein